MLRRLHGSKPGRAGGIGGGGDGNGKASWTMSPGSFQLPTVAFSVEELLRRDVPVRQAP